MLPADCQLLPALQQLDIGCFIDVLSPVLQWAQLQSLTHLSLRHARPTGASGLSNLQVVERFMAAARPEVVFELHDGS